MATAIIGAWIYGTTERNLNRLQKVQNDGLHRAPGFL